jgi:methoxymalonate biosynthesis protein
VGASESGPSAVIKCVVWDLDNTLLSGVYLESAGQPPAADQAILGVAAELGGRGILHALATRNPPEAEAYAAQATGLRFAAAECGWGRKSDAVRRVIADLGLAPDAVAYVDDDPYERAEVSFALPEVLVLAPEEMPDAVGWPEFSPAVVTAEARRRGEMYAERRRRQQEARGFAGSREEFLRYCRTEVTISPADPADLPRLQELAVRTHQFNSAGGAVSEAALRSMISSAGPAAAAPRPEAAAPPRPEAAAPPRQEAAAPLRPEAAAPPRQRLVTVRLSDRFGDDGLVGACVVDRGESGTWTVPLLMMSCRAIGRGVIEALLAWLCQAAARGGADALAVPCVISGRNVPLRLALAGAGFRAPAGGEPGRAREGAAGRDSPAGSGRALFSRPLTGPAAAPLPVLPGWVAAAEEP